MCKGWKFSSDDDDDDVDENLIYALFFWTSLYANQTNKPKNTKKER